MTNRIIPIYNIKTLYFKAIYLILNTLIFIVFLYIKEELIFLWNPISFYQYMYIYNATRFFSTGNKKFKIFNRTYLKNKFCI